MQAEGYLALGNEQLHYLKWGTGSKLLIALHGYGNEAGIFSPFSKYLGGSYTIIAFNLPHHNKSKWTENTPFSKEHLQTLVTTLMEEYGADKVSLLAYSIGGRLSMVIIEMMPQLIDKALLMAPDGLVFDPFYIFVTKTWLGRRMFKDLVNHPDRYLKFYQFLKERKIVSEPTYKFAMRYLATDADRRFLLQVWPAFKTLIPDKKNLATAIRQYKIPVFLFMGKHDKTIKPRFANWLEQHTDTVQVTVLEKGHRVFDETNAEEIARVLL